MYILCQAEKEKKSKVGMRCATKNMHSYFSVLGQAKEKKGRSPVRRHNIAKYVKLFSNPPRACAIFLWQLILKLAGGAYEKAGT